MRLLERVAAPAKGTATTTAAASASGGKGATEVASSIEATINPDGDEWKLHQATPFGLQRVERVAPIFAPVQQRPSRKKSSLSVRRRKTWEDEGRLSGGARASIPSSASQRPRARVARKERSARDENKTCFVLDERRACVGLLARGISVRLCGRCVVPTLCTNHGNTTNSHPLLIAPSTPGGPL